MSDRRAQIHAAFFGHQHCGLPHGSWRLLHEPICLAPKGSYTVYRIADDVRPVLQGDA
jgi:hypothetical protein